MRSTRPLAVVTGGAGPGVGSGIARVLARDGWDLLIVDRDEGQCASLQTQLGSQTSVECLALELTDDETPNHVAAAAQKSHGRIDGLVNNAAIGCVGPANAVTDALFDQTMSINVRAAFRLTRRLFDLLKIVGGAVVNISSVHERQPMSGFSVYAATKGAIEAMTRGWAVDFGPHGIRVNCVAPGMVDCPQTRAVTAKHAADVDLYLKEWVNSRQLLPNLVSNLDVGELVGFLLGRRAQGITGQTIVIDAGTTLLLTDRD